MSFKTLNILILALFGGLSASGQFVERKIIIEDDQFHYVTVDDNFQIATLYKGNVNQPLETAKAYALPAGRGISAETNPLAWDIHQDTMYAISFLDHSLNDRNESIKRFSLDGLHQWSEEGMSMERMIMESVDQNMYVINEPYLFVKQRSIYMNHFYFDAVQYKGSYWVAMANNDELTVWRYDGNGWEHSEVIEFPIKGYFSLYMEGDELILMNQAMGTFKIGLKGAVRRSNDRPTETLTNFIFVEDRDQNKKYILEANSINLVHSLQDVLKEFGKPWGN